MFSIIGIFVVFGAIVGGYLMEHGNLRVLMQPAELVIILTTVDGVIENFGKPNPKTISTIERIDPSIE